jgi:hypothetical protein
MRMAKPPPYRDFKGDTGDDTSRNPYRGSATETPRWKYVMFGIIAIGLVLLLIVLHLTGVLGPGAHTQ